MFGHPWSPQIAYPAEDHAARRRDVVDHDVSRPLLARLCVGHVGEGDQPIEAITKDGVPRGDRVVDRVELFIGGVRMGFDRDRQGSVVPPVAGVVIAQDLESLGIDLGSLQVGAASSADSRGPRPPRRATALRR